MGLVGRGQERIGVGVAPAVADGRALQAAAEVIRRQLEGMVDARVGQGLAGYAVQGALIIKIDYLSLMREKAGVAESCPGLEQLDGVIALGDVVGPVGGLAAVQPVDLLAQELNP